MADFIPADPDFRDRMATRFSTPIVRFFGIEQGAVEPSHVTLVLDCRPELGHQQGWFQGSVTTAIAEFAAAWSASTLIPPGWSNLTLDQTIKFVGAAQGDRLIARGSVIKPGRTITSCLCEVFAVRDGGEQLCAVMLQTNRHAPPK